MHFVGVVRTEWLTHERDDRRMRLLEDFAFVDSVGCEWTAPAGDVIDGASIPSFLWSVVGSPFTGDYRRASVLHDVYCQRQSRSSRDVHRMFYEAMITDGVVTATALKLYGFVRLFGERWDVAGAKGTAPPVAFEQVEASLDVIIGETQW